MAATSTWAARSPTGRRIFATPTSSARPSSTGRAATSARRRIFDVDLTHPGAAQVRARLTFEDTSSGDLFEVELALHRGWDDLLLYSPADLQVPSGLVTRLEPIAASTVIDPQPKRTLIARQELRE
ncbi:hypothetical protein ACFQL0_21385 [Haloplanus litoreus]|uniref:hypothetical protein n=1 Tax=Haloplanus litoreus TaxID=767515 RepID=UPI00361952F7